MLKSEKIKDLGRYSIDIREQLENALAEELSKSIDMEIMKQVFKAHREHRKEKTKKILGKIQQMKQKGI